MIKENIVIGENSKYPLKGVLTLPDDLSKTIPAVVFVHGSGSSNMDEKVGKLTPFKDLAEGLAECGIASIRYDKRSFAHGLKMLRDKSTLITVKEETIDDAILATEILRNDSRIDSEKIFIIGHSMGAMLAPRIDAEGGNYRGLIIMAGTPRKLEDVLIEQNNEALSEIKGFLKKLLEKQITKMNAMFDGLYELSDEEAKAKKFGGGTTLYYFKEMGEHPSSTYLLNTKKPLLFMQGSKDVQVNVDRDFGAYKEMLKDKPNANFKLYENLNHAFVTAFYETITNARKEFKVERHIPEIVISDIADWIFSVSN